MTQSQWVLAQPPDEPPREVAARGSRLGFTNLRAQTVSLLRYQKGGADRPKHKAGRPAARPAGKPGPKPKSLAPVRKPQQQAFTQDEQAFMGLALRFGTERALELVDQAHQIAVHAVNAVPTRR